MLFKLITDNRYGVVDGILARYNVKKSQIDSPRNIITRGYHNMDKAVAKIVEMIKQNKKIAVLADEDADGYCSATIIYKYFQDMDYPIDILVHGGKVHGITAGILAQVKQNDIEFLIIPDACSNDELLVKIPCDVVVIDHHQIEGEVPSNTIRVNNQDILNENSNPNLTGVGMSYRVLQELDEALGLHNADNNIDVVAIGQIADSSDISDEEVRFIVNKGINNITNKLFTSMLQDRINRKEEITPRDLSFEVIPYINAVCRVGSHEDRVNLLKAMTGEEDYWDSQIVKRRRKDKRTGKFILVDVEISNCDRYFSHDLSTIKKRQNDIVTDTLKTVVENVYMEGGVVVAIGSKEIEKSITGLVAAKLTTIYDRPAILLLGNEEDEVYTGSIRGKEAVIDSLKAWCEDTGLFDWVQGHPNAAGCCISKANLSKLVEATKTLVPKDYLEVDDICKQVTPEMVDYFYDNRRYYGGKVTYPKIGIEGMMVYKKNVTMRGTNTLVITQGNVDYIIFNVTQEQKNMLLQGFSPSIVIDIFGEPSINYFRGKKNRQIIVNKITLSSVEQKFDFDF